MRNTDADTNPAGRQHTLLDRCLIELDTAVRVLATSVRPVRPSPATAMPADADPVTGSPDPHRQPGTPASVPSRPADRALSAALMRVNHAGEISAQALYRGQAFVARDPQVRAALLRAAADEQDHLAWCRERVAQLGRRTSLLDPFWFGGSFAIGTVAGLAGDAVSLGFIAETERQVAAHLDGHLQRLPADDDVSRRIVRQMRADEIAHGLEATRRGARDLPRPVRAAMRLMSRAMTTVAFRI